MIQRQLFRRDFGPAIITTPGSDAVLPPLALAQLAGFGALTANIFFGYFQKKIHENPFVKWPVLHNLPKYAIY